MSVNEAGMSLISAVDHVRGSELGPLGIEVDRVWTDVQWGAESWSEILTRRRLVALAEALLSLNGGRFEPRPRWPDQPAGTGGTERGCHARS